ncbi:MAG: hypothetical protein LUE16_05525 [Lachnospiraceae bacterium]|nr:hypothetical protein [Lachnospiraceae bacterium]
MQKKVLVTLAVAAVLALAPVGVKGVITASASSNDTVTATSNTVVVASEEVDVVEQYKEHLRAVEDEIEEAAATATESGTDEAAVVAMYSGYNEYFSLPNSIMQLLVKYDNVDLVMNYTYDEVSYVITIPAGEAIDDDTPWYGPLYLIDHYGTEADKEAAGLN